MALDAAIERGGEIVVAAQKAARTHAPAADDIHRVGTLCSVKGMVPLPDGTRSVLLVGRRRVRIEHFERSADEGLLAEIEEIEEPAASVADVDALMDAVRAVVAELPKERMSAEAVDVVRTTFDPGLLADVIGGSLREFAASPDIEPPSVRSCSS